MESPEENLLHTLRTLATKPAPRMDRLKQAATALLKNGGYRWVGLYDVDYGAKRVVNAVWDGPGPPEFPVFPLTKGLTASAINDRKTVNVGDVASDSRYLTAFSTTRSEIIVPVLTSEGLVAGTIDIESESRNAFDASTQHLLERCAEVLRPLWAQTS
jgi:putative methionine-R-sulfoxide reductase with GAF domain